MRRKHKGDALFSGR